MPRALPQNLVALSLLKSPSAFAEQELTNLVWASATLGVGNQELQARFTDEMLRRGLNTFTPQALSNVVWAHAVVGFLNPEYLKVRPRARVCVCVCATGRSYDFRRDPAGQGPREQGLTK